MGNEIVRIEKVCKRFGPTIALNNVDIQVNGGEIRGLIGENGSGKSTVSSIYAGMQKADSGKMFYKGQAWNPSSMVEALNHGVGMILQETGTIPGITIAENIFLGESDEFRMIKGKNGKKYGPISSTLMNKAAQKILDSIGASHIRASALTAGYDLQDRKLVEIAHVICKKPEVLIVDETTTALSQKGREIIYKIVNHMKEEGKCVIFISHDLDEIMNVCNVLTVLRDGKIIRTFSKEQFNANDIRAAMIGREMKGDYYRSDFDPTCSKEVSLKADHISLGDKIHDVSIEFHRGEIIGIGGLSECGMHDLGKILFGNIIPTSGEVLVSEKNDQTEVVKDEKLAMKKKIGYVAKDRDLESLNMQMSIRDNVAVAGLNLIATKQGLITNRREKAYVKTNIDALSTKCYSIDQGVRQLSGGNKQKVVFAKWLGCKSDIMILDCPTRGIDVGVKQTMYQLIYKMKKEGKTIIIISEELAELIGMSDRLIIMKDGKISKEFLRSPNLSDKDVINYMI
ncbi:MAG: sugar ABC transporter ATP-binding protein [Bacilli bacterium]|nr:sugar ABC transporter ATP-binding protein [Bacilli bacterium]